MRRFLVLVILAALQWTGGHGRWMRPGDILDEPLSSVVDEDAGPHSDVYLLEGQQLKLTVADRTNHRLAFTRWYYNGRPVAERTRRGCQVTYDKMVCSQVDRQDEGRYEVWGSDGSNNRYLILSANVHVISEPVKPWESEPVARMLTEVEPVPATSRYSEDCFCSGVTSRCRMAKNLYRMRKSFDLSSAEPVDFLTPTARKAEPYVAIPGTTWSGNLITAYGGYLRFPITNECYTDRSEPCVVFVDRYDQAIGHYLPPRHAQRELSVLMKEASWRLLKAPRDTESEPYARNTTQQLDKHTFMSVLSNIEMAYVRGSYGSLENVRMTIDLASPYDEGLGTVSTVEECFCHEGYEGLSCERCAMGYGRYVEVINSSGVCVSEKALWHYIKEKHRV